MRLWLDDIRKEPDGYKRCLSVNQMIKEIQMAEARGEKIEELNLDHDLGDFYYDGGDGVKLLDWLEETGRYYPCTVHSMNPVGRKNMERIIARLERYRTNMTPMKLE